MLQILKNLLGAGASGSQPVNTALTPITGSKKVIVFTGWAGAGKTTLVKQLVSGLNGQLPKVAGIINEQSNSGSINVDLGRLPAAFDKLGMAGCICCVGVKQVKEALTRFDQQGKLLTVIEQSPLSNTSDLRRAIYKHGFSPYVIAVIKPGQIVPRYSAEQVRAADAIVIAGKADNQVRRIIRELTSDLKYKPEVFEIDGANYTYPAGLWELSQDIVSDSVTRQRNEESAISASSGKQRQLDVQHFTELQIIPYPLKAGEPIEDRAALLARELGGLQDSNRTPIEIIRVKGVVAGHDLDITRTAKGLTHSVQSRESPRSDLSPDQDYIYLRSLDSGLKGCWKKIFEVIGTPICSENAVKAVSALYPSKAEMINSLRSSQQLAGVFEADSLLWELGDTLQYFQSIPDPDRQQELGMAIVALTEKFLQSRLDVLEVLQMPEAKSLPDYQNILFDTLFIGIRVLVHPQINTLFQADSGQERLIQMSEALWELKPVEMLLETLSSLKDLKINGSHDINSNDLAWLKLFITEGIRRESNSGNIHKLAFSALQSLTSVAKNTGNHAWISYNPLIKESLGIG